MHSRCPKGHTNSWHCHKVQPKACIKCEADDKRVQKEMQRDLKLQEKREQQEREHLEHIAKLDEMLENERQRVRDQQLLEERSRHIQQKEQDLARARARITSKPESRQLTPGGFGGVATVNPSAASNLGTTTQHSSVESTENVVEPPSSPQAGSNSYWKIGRESLAKQDWEQQKRVGNPRNEAIDSLMEMVGLEEVKTQMLLIKANIELSRRQNSNTKQDRLNAAFLGNPGTGSCCYDKFVSMLTKFFNNRQDYCSSLICAYPDFSGSNSRRCFYRDYWLTAGS